MKKDRYYIKQSLLYYRPVWGWLILCAVLGLSRMGLLLIEPQVVSLMVDRVLVPALGGMPVDNSGVLAFLIEGIPGRQLWKIFMVLSGAFVGFLALFFVTFYLRWNLSHYVSLQVENRMRTQLLDKMNHIGPAVLRKYTAGELITIINRDTSRVRDLYIAVIPFMIDQLFYLVMASWFLARTNVLLLMGPLVTFVFYLFITRGFIKKSEEYYNNMWKQESLLNTEAQESIYGIRTIRAFGGERYRYRRFAERSESMRDFYINFGRTRYRYFLFYDVMDQILLAGTMAVSIWLASRFLMTEGEYSAFLGYMLLMAEAFVDILFLFGDLQECKVSAKRAFELLEYKDPLDERFGVETVSRTPHIRFEDVSVADGEQEILRGVSIDIPYGSKIGVMGSTGSGKSVFLKTMQGFTEYTGGRILIDGRDFYQYEKSEIARTYSYAMQEVFLFSNSIAANIAFYRPDGNTEEIVSCGQAAEVDEFARSFPDGYDTIIGEKGFGLSGGQKQRVAIARALYKDAPVLILDDCTSALDVETEQKIFCNLKEAARDKTLILATHRAKAIADCDEILFFEDGRIVERGTFDELMDAGGRYSAVYHLQEE